jgi:hypothetical protein
MTPIYDRWKNRRRMAWASLIAGMAYPLLLWVTDSDQLGAVAGPFYIFVGAVVGAYMGFATLDDHWQGKPPGTGAGQQAPGER